MDTTLEEAFSLSDDELYQAIGIELQNNSQNVSVPSAREATEIAKAYLGAIKDDVCQAVCGNETIKRLCADGCETRDLAAAMLDIISGLVFDVSPGFISVHFARKGVENLCADHWSATV